MHKCNNLVETLLVYKIPYRRARAWPSSWLGRVRVRAKVSCIPNSVQSLSETTFKMIRWLDQCVLLSLYFDLLPVLNVKFFKYLYNSPIIILDSILWSSQLHQHVNCPAIIPATHLNYVTADERNLGCLLSFIEYLYPVGLRITQMEPCSRTSFISSDIVKIS